MAAASPFLIASLLANVILVVLVLQRQDACEILAQKRQIVPLHVSKDVVLQNEMCSCKQLAECLQSSSSSWLKSKNSKSLERKRHQSMSDEATENTQVLPDVFNTQYALDHPPKCSRGPGLFFVDLGANCGNSYQLFLKEIFPTLKTATKRSLRAFLFEFNPNLVQHFLFPLTERDTRVELVQAAAHIREGSIVAYLDKRKENPGQFPCVARRNSPNPAGASSLLKGMPRAGQAINVTAVSIPNFFRNHFCSGDEIHLKIDIEGFEYTLLEAMINEGINCWVDTFYIEFHDVGASISFMGANMSSKAAEKAVQSKLQECSVVKEWW